MLLDPGSAEEFIYIARELGADVFEGKLSYSPTESLLVEDTGVGEYLDHFNAENVLIIFDELGDADEEAG